MRGASPSNYGNFPVRPEQIVVAGYLAAEICYFHGIDPRGTVELDEHASDANKWWPTGGKIIMPRVTHHQAFARKDGYEADRWDVTDAIMAEIMKVCLVHYDELVKTHGAAAAYKSSVI